MRRSIILNTVLALAAINVVACSPTKEEIKIDYASAEIYEAALNNGENTINKVVKFIADELHPNSAFGYNIYAGEHLNFISDFDPEVKVGDTLIVEIKDVASFLSSWLIKYDKLK